MRDQDRSLGAYIGAAIGDAMGGPVECNHAARIRRLVGEIEGLLPYRKPYTLINLHPGYALHADAGSVTDDTFIRGDFTRFFLSTEPPRTPKMLADWMIENADFSQWYQPIIEALRRVERGEATAEDCGLTFTQGGGLGWWTPIGIIHAEDPEKAAMETKNLCRIWKAPLEQDFASAAQAGVAAGMRHGASADSVIEAILGACGPLATSLLQRAIDIAKQARDIQDLVGRLYNNVLLPGSPEPSREADGPMPASLQPLEDSEKPYSSIFFAEQAPLAMAAFVFGAGEPRSIACAVMIGRDADSVATTVGSWVGALHGESGLPGEWVDTVCEVNLKEIDIRGLAERLYLLPA